jgi:hypothetical protein
VTAPSAPEVTVVLAALKNCLDEYAIALADDVRMWSRVLKLLYPSRTRGWLSVSKTSNEDRGTQRIPWRFEELWASMRAWVPLRAASRRRGDRDRHLSSEQPLKVGESITIGSQSGIVRAIEPLLGERELRLIMQLRRDDLSTR